MCTATLALGGLMAGAGLYQNVAQSRAIKAQGEAQASAMERNAEMAQYQAHDAIERGGLKELRLRRALAQNLGNQRVQAAASGIDTDSGSVQDARDTTISEGEHDAEAIRFNAARERWGYNTQAANLQTQANYTRAASRANARNILTGGVVNFGLDLGQTIYEDNKLRSPLTEPEDRSKYWGPMYNPREARKRGLI